MAFRDLIPWSRQENRFPVPVSAERDRDRDNPLLSLHREVNRLFDNVFPGFGIPTLGGFDRSLSWPNLELGDTDKEIRITAELPGLEEKDVEITVEDGVLTLRGEKRSATEDKDRGYSERSYGRFERSIALPRGVEHDKSTATFDQGVLTITLPKSTEAIDNGRRIPINGATRH